MFEPAYLRRAEAILAAARALHIKIATAESCTGGLVSALLTEIPGSSDVLERGYTTYSNVAKAEVLGVPVSLLATHGAVSDPVARAMAEGALEKSGTELTVAITGIAGPGGGSALKPVGLVHFAAARRGHTTIAAEHRFGPQGRHTVRMLSVGVALDLLERHLGLHHG